MIQENIIKSNLLGIVGWNEPTISGLPTLDSGNTGSTSGLKFDEAHPLVSINNLYHTVEDKDLNDANFNTLLDRLQEDTIIRVCEDVFGTDTRHLETKTMFPFERSFENTQTPGSGFMCVQLAPPLNRRLVYVLNAVSIALDSAKTFNIYLYNSSKKTALQSKSVTSVAGEEVKTALGWVISPVSPDYSGGNFYIGYAEADLDGAKPYKRDWDRANEELESEKFISEFQRIGISSGVIDVTDYTNLEEPYGINLEWSVYVDSTDLIVSNKHLFGRAIQYGMAIKVLQTIRSTTRSNIEQRLTDDFRGIADFELEGAKHSLVPRYRAAIAELKEHFVPRKTPSKGQFV